MKKVISLLSVIALLICFSACANQQNYDENVRGDQVVNTSDTKTEETEDYSGGSVEMDENADSGESTDIVTEKQEFSLGKVEGLVYENKYAGFGCSFESDWTFYSDEQIKQLNNATADLAGDDYKELMEKADYFFDMYVVDSEQLDNVNVVFEKRTAVEIAAIDFDEFYKNTIPTIKQNFENMGYTDITCEISSVQIDGVEFKALKSHALINGIEMYQVTFSKICGNYIVSVAVTTYNENTVDDIISNFYLL